MKKPLSILLIAAMVLSLCACGQSSPDGTEPSQTVPATNAPTAPDISTEPTVCTHAPEIIQNTPANCTDAGCIISVCPLCGEEFTEIIPAIGHNFTAATCTQAKTCANCGTTEGDALGHNYVSGVCDRCSANMPGYEEKPAGCDHKYDLTAQTSPTCTAGGSFMYTCGKCGDAYTETVSAKGHVYADATCEQANTCHVCGTASGEALGHSFADGNCSRCGAIDPSVPTEVTYTVTVRSDKGKPVEGVTVYIFTDADTPAAIGKTSSKGVAAMTLLSAESYKVILSDVPVGLSAKESYTFRSTQVNINLTTVSQISPDDHSKANYKVGSIMGNFTLTDTDGNSYTLSELLKEKELVILNFWFVNCGPCKAEFPYFEAISKEYENVQLLTMNHIDTEAEIIALREQMGVTFPMIWENIGLQEGFGLYAYPTTVFIDSSGRILKIQVGDFKSQQELETLINSFLK